MKSPVEAGCPTPWTFVRREDGSVYIDDANGDAIYNDEEQVIVPLPRDVVEWIVAMVNSCAEEV